MIFNSDTTWAWTLIFGPWGAIGVGFLVGYFLNNTSVIVFTGIVIILIILAAIDGRGKELGSLSNLVAILIFILLLASLWITTISVNHWWTNIILAKFLR